MFPESSYFSHLHQDHPESGTWLTTAPPTWILTFHFCIFLDPSPRHSSQRDPREMWISSLYPLLKTTTLRILLISKLKSKVLTLIPQRPDFCYLFKVLSHSLALCPPATVASPPLKLLGSGCKLQSGCVGGGGGCVSFTLVTFPLPKIFSPRNPLS